MPMCLAFRPGLHVKPQEKYPPGPEMPRKIDRLVTGIPSSVEREFSVFHDRKSPGVDSFGISAKPDVPPTFNEENPWPRGSTVVRGKPHSLKVRIVSLPPIKISRIEDIRPRGQFPIVVDDNNSSFTPAVIHILFRQTWPRSYADNGFARPEPGDLVGPASSSDFEAFDSFGLGPGFEECISAMPLLIQCRPRNC